MEIGIGLPATIPGVTGEQLTDPDRASAREHRAARQAGRDLHHLSGGRLVLGLAPGGRGDDYEVSGDYYAFLGEDIAGAITAGAATDADTIKQHISAFEQAGCDELILFPSNSNPDQVDLLAEAIA